MAGYGTGFLAALGDVCRRTVRRALREYKIPLGHPVHAVAWGLAKRRRRDLADQVLEAYGYERRYTRSR